MGNETMWDDSNVSEYEMMEEDIAEQVQTAEEMAEEIADEMDAEHEEPEIVEASDEQIEYVQEQSAYDLDDQESNVIFNARLRLEQAKLYEMLINHPLFQGVDASEEATGIVENEIKHFIVKRLELLLGIRKPKPRTVQVSEVELPFNEVEVDALKSLAYKMSKGQSASAAPMRISSQTGLRPLTGSTQSQINPIGRPKIKPQQPLDLPTPQPKPKQQLRKRRVAPKAPVQTKARPQPKAKPKKNSTEVRPKVSSGGNMSKRKLTTKEIEDLAKADLENMKGRKSISKLKGKAKEKLIKEVNDKHARAAMPKTQDFPTAKQLEMKYLTQQANGNSPESVLNNMAKNILNHRKLKP